VHSAEFQIHVPGFAPTQIVIQLQRLVLCQYAYGVDIGVDAVGQGEIDDPVFPAEGNCRFGCCLGKRHQLAALTAGKQHGNDLFSFAHERLISLSYIA